MSKDFFAGRKQKEEVVSPEVAIVTTCVLSPHTPCMPILSPSDYNDLHIPIRQILQLISVD